MRGGEAKREEKKRNGERASARKEVMEKRHGSGCEPHSSRTKTCHADASPRRHTYLVLNSLRSTSVAERIGRFLKCHGTRRNASNHERHARTAQTVLEQHSQRGVAVWDVSVALLRVAERGNAVAEG